MSFQLKRAWKRAVREQGRFQQLIVSIRDKSRDFLVAALGFLTIEPYTNLELSGYTSSYSTVIGIALFALVLTYFLARPIGIILDFTAYLLERHRFDIEALVTNEHEVYPSTAEFVKRNGINATVLGGAVEMFRRDVDRVISNNGWASTSVLVTQKPGFLSAPSFKDVDFKSVGENKTKYTLVEFDRVGIDDFDELRLRVVETDWYQSRPTSSALSKSAELRRDKLSREMVNPNIPSILCLHAACLTKDNEVLGLLRRKTSFSDYRVSISFEEQMDSTDFSGPTDDVVSSWFARALCEEVFPLSRTFKKDARTAWSLVKDHVRFMRIWSGIYEETIGGNALFGVCQLSLSAKELVEFNSRLGRERNDLLDNEGDPLLLSIAGLSQLVSDPSRPVPFKYLYGNDANSVMALSGSGFSGRQNEYGPFLLHPTSLYRASLLAACMELKAS